MIDQEVHGLLAVKINGRADLRLDRIDVHGGKTAEPSVDLFALGVRLDEDHAIDPHTAEVAQDGLLGFRVLRADGQYAPVAFFMQKFIERGDLVDHQRAARMPEADADETVDLPLSPRASGLGWKPSSCIAASTRSLVACLTSGCPLMARDTVHSERPRYLARSRVDRTFRFSSVFGFALFFDITASPRASAVSPESQGSKSFAGNSSRAILTITSGCDLLLACCPG